MICQPVDLYLSFCGPRSEDATLASGNVYTRGMTASHGVSLLRQGAVAVHVDQLRSKFDSCTHDVQHLQVGRVPSAMSSPNVLLHPVN